MIDVQKQVVNAARSGDLAVINAHRQAIRQTLARNHLYDFVQYTFPGFIDGWFPRDLCRQLEQFYHRLQRGERPRLIIQTPPRFGKTESVSVRFLCWLLGQNPDASIISCGYGADLPERNSRFCHDLIDSNQYTELFPAVALSTHRADTWTIAGHRGVVRAAGIGGGISGFGADVLIVDDWCKDQQEASSSTIQQRNWDWWTRVAYPRLSPTGGVIIIGTRWDLNDLVGMILNAAESSGEKWDVVTYRAIAEEDEEHRRIGEPLHPERYPLHVLMEIKAQVKEGWLPLYQQRPQMTQGQCYFTVPGDEPADKILQTYHSACVPCKERAVVTDEGKLIQDETSALAIWEESNSGFMYCAGLDTALGEDAAAGSDTDSHVLSILRRGVPDSIRQDGFWTPHGLIGTIDKPAYVAHYVSKVDVDKLAFEIAPILEYYNFAFVLVESNAAGVAVLNILKSIYPLKYILRDSTQGLSEIYQRDTRKLGLYMDVHKPALLADFKGAFRERKFDYFNEQGVFQWRHFVNKDGKLQAEYRYHDDYVIADALAWRAHLKAPRSIPHNYHSAQRLEPKPKVRPLFSKIGY